MDSRVVTSSVLIALWRYSFAMHRLGLDTSLDTSPSYISVIFHSSAKKRVFFFTYNSSGKFSNPGVELILLHLRGGVKHLAPIQEVWALSQIIIF